MSADVFGAFALESLSVDPSSFDPSKVLLQLRPEGQPEQVAPLLPGSKFEAAAQHIPGWYEVHLSDKATVDAALAAFAASSSVAYVEPDYRIQLENTVIPNDPSFGSLWGLHNTGQSGGTADADIDAAEVWSVTTGSSSTIVAVIDTGVDYTHPDLAPNIWVNPGEIAGNGVDDDGNGFVDDVHGYDFVNNDPDPMDDQGHGTHVAGTIGAVGGNGVGVAGVSWDVQIMPLKFLDAEGSGYLSDAVRALDYAVANGARISNNSWGGGGYSHSMYNALLRARNADHIFVAAAGNDGTNNDSAAHYPSSYDLDNVISVAATDRNDDLASFSNYGPSSVDLGAPGVSILSTTPGSTYSVYSGTSMATPHVSGAVALVQSEHPDWSYSQVVQQLLSTVDPLATLQGKTVTGGRLNAAAAVGGGNVDTSGPYVVNSEPVGVALGEVSSVRITFDEPLDLASFAAADVGISGPDGAIPVTTVSVVAGSNNQQFDIHFPAQTSLGQYTAVIGPQLADVAGNLMDQDQDGRLGEPVDDRFTFAFSISQLYRFASEDVPVQILDRQTATSTLVVDQSLEIRDLNVQVDLTHTWDNDLRIYLDSPNGTRVHLAQYRGGSGDDYQSTVFDDEAAIPIGAGSAPFAGAFQPEEPLAAFDGENAQGTWRLSIWDRYFWDQGKLNGWSLIIQTPAVNHPPQLSPISDRTMPGSQDALTIPLTATDPDGDRLSFQAGILSGAEAFANLAFQLDQRLGLYYTGNYYENWGGRAEKWLHSASRTWYFILPSGDLYQWDGKRDLGTSQWIAALDGTYHASPARLHDAVDPRASDEIAYELDQQLDLYFTGNYYENWGGWGEKWLRSAHSGWYFLTPAGGAYQWNRKHNLGSSQLVTTLDPSYHANPTRLYDAPEPIPTENLDGSIVTLNDDQLVINPAAGFVGDLRVKVTATDGVETVADTFVVTVTARPGESSFNAGATSEQLVGTLGDHRLGLPDRHVAAGLAVRLIGLGGHGRRPDRAFDSSSADSPSAFRSRHDAQESLARDWMVADGPRHEAALSSGTATSERSSLADDMLRILDEIEDLLSQGALLDAEHSAPADWDFSVDDLSFGTLNLLGL